MRFTHSAFAAAAILCTASLASAAFIETFNSYDNAAEFQAAWKPWTSPTSSMNFNLSGGINGSHGVSGTPTVNNNMRNYRNLDSFTEYRGTDEQPVRFQFWLYDNDSAQPASPNGARNFLEMRAYVGDGIRPFAEGNVNLQGLIAMGLYNAPVSDDNYHARVYFGGVNYWYNLNTARTQGWHKMTASIGESFVKFYVDDQLDTTVSLLNPSRLFAFDGVLLGSGLTSGGYDVTFDNLSVVHLPEPLTLLSFALGALLLRYRRRPMAG